MEFNRLMIFGNNILTVEIERLRADNAAQRLLITELVDRIAFNRQPERLVRAVEPTDTSKPSKMVEGMGDPVSRAERAALEESHRLAGVTDA